MISNTPPHLQVTMSKCMRAMLLKLDSVKCLGEHVGHHVRSGTVDDVDETVLELLAGEVEADVEVLRVARGDGVASDVDRWLVVLADCDGSTLNADVAKEI